jgi:hypothetical protein
MNTTLTTICVVLGIFGVGLFMRAYHLGNETLNKIDKKDRFDKN